MDTKRLKAPSGDEIVGFRQVDGNACEYEFKISGQNMVLNLIGRTEEIEKTEDGDQIVVDASGKEWPFLVARDHTIFDF